MLTEALSFAVDSVGEVPNELHAKNSWLIKTQRYWFSSRLPQQSQDRLGADVGASVRGAKKCHACCVRTFVCV